MTLWDIYEKSKLFRQAEGGEIGKEAESLFVCGILLRELFCPETEVLYPQTEYTTEQLWYLLCLHHDRRLEKRILWEVACRQTSIPDKIERWEAQNIRTATEWRPMSLSFSPTFVYGEKGICFSGNICVKKSPVPEEKVKDLFWFRNTCSKTEGMDHGIAGGLLLYENLLYRHLEQKEELDDDVVHLGAYLANVLMVHHMLKEEGAASMKKNPLLFLLILAEAIEPLHYMQSVSKTETVLRSIGLEVADKEIVLRPDVNRFPAEKYAYHIASAAEKTGVECQRNEYLSEIRIKMYESPIIDELFI